MMLVMMMMNVVSSSKTKISKMMILVVMLMMNVVSSSSKTIYTAVFLDDASRAAVLERFPKRLLDNVYAEHTTIKFAPYVVFECGVREHLNILQQYSNTNSNTNSNTGTKPM